MGNNWYSFDVDPLWVFLALLAAFVLALLLYSRKNLPWGKGMNVFMGFLRFSSVFLILLLLLNPLLELNINKIEQPTVIYAMDNSESIILRESGPNPEEIKTWLQASSTSLRSAYDVVIEGIKDSLTFDEKVTDLSKLLKDLENKYEEKNLGAIVLVSDGIINKGQSPAYQNFKFPVYTVGLGDTIPPKDIAIQNIRSNQVAYQGNQFPVSIKIYQKGYSNVPISVKILEGRKVIAEKQVETSQTELSFQINADTPGLRRLTVAVEQKEGESSYENNRKDIYVDVIEGKDKILILAPAPHPDINAIRTVLDATSNYETVLYIPGIHNPPKEKEFDLVIEHQAFSGTRYGDFKSSGKWDIVGDRSNIRRISQEVNYLNLAVKGNDKDQVRGAFNESFSKFKLNPDLIDRLRQYPPIKAPFGDYQLSGPSEIFLYQKVGSVTTSRPLMLFFDDGSSKSCLTMADGFWQWKLQEYGQEENSDLFEQIILKTTQYLSIKVNKDRFVVKPRDANYQIGDRVFIDTEVYNEIYERTYGNTIKLTIADEEGNTSDYEMVDSQINSSFNIGSMEPGVYTYTASTKLGSRSFSENGSFAVRDIQLEGIDLTANHNLLRSLSGNSGGQFVAFSDASRLDEILADQSFTDLIKTNREQFPLINSLWIILLIGLFLTTEWFLRKYLGAY
ncbi:MAG: hypothetical protein RIC35_24055 [Marinoscillum sp.]